ncbi:MAG: MerR family transcriptional regulator [Alphaproteobacteria bacterium]|nr:MAG: MerR family transcriptional regulator [Alphaproteobacteria bacterium]
MMRVYSEMEVLGLVSGLTRRRLRRWCRMGLVVPAMREPGGAPLFADIDVARISLIRELIEDMGVNEAGVEIILDLLDQLHALHRNTRQLAAALADLDAPTRERLAARLQDEW